MDIRSAVNERLAALRATTITSQRQLAAALGVDAGQLNAELSGRRPMPVGRLEAIEGLLGLELIGGAR